MAGFYGRLRYLITSPKVPVPVLYKGVGMCAGGIYLRFVNRSTLLNIGRIIYTGAKELVHPSFASPLSQTLTTNSEIGVMRSNTWAAGYNRH